MPHFSPTPCAARLTGAWFSRAHSRFEDAVDAATGSASAYCSSSAWKRGSSRIGSQVGSMRRCAGLTHHNDLPSFVCSAMYCPRESMAAARSEEHTSELQSLMRISYAVFCLKKKNNTIRTNYI